MFDEIGGAEQLHFKGFGLGCSFFIPLSFPICQK
jgi:hypothetical protein